MTDRTPHPPLLATIGAYFFLFTLALWPITDVLFRVLPPQLGRQEWRFGAAGLLAGYLLLPIMAIGLAMVLAFVLRHVRVLRSLSVLALAGAVFLLLATVSLGLDLVGFWTLGTPEGLPGLQRGAVIAELKHISGLVALALLGIGAWQGSRQLSEELAARKKV
jgi:hypothetical protein